jgi:hypothetical protein
VTKVWPAPQRWATELIATLTQPHHRRLLTAYTTWRILRRLRRGAAQRPRPRTYTADAHVRLRAAVDFLTWLADQNLTLADCRQPMWTYGWTPGPRPATCATSSSGPPNTSTARHSHVAPPPRNNGRATEPEQRWAQVTRLLHEQTIDLTDRVAGCLLLLYGQQLSRIAAMTTDQLTQHDGTVMIRFGRDEIDLPEKLGPAVLELIHAGRSYTGLGSPNSRWLFPGLLPGKPITASRLGERLRKLGITALPGRRSSMIHLAGHLPAAVLADLLNLAPSTALRWMHQAGADWTRYAAALAQTHDPQP